MIMYHGNSQSDSNNPPFKKKGSGSNNSSTTNLNDHPSPFNFSKMGPEEEQKKPKVKETTQQNRSFITGKIGDKIISLPLMYPPPKVESQQVVLVERTVDQSVENTLEVESIKQEEDYLEEKTAMDESVREEKISLLEMEFTSLLEESPSLLEKTSSTQEAFSEITEESDPLINETFLMLIEESDSNVSKSEETESFENMAAEKIASMLEDEDDDFFMEETTSLPEEESPPFLKETALSLEEEVSSLLEWDSVSTKKDFALFSKEDPLLMEEESPLVREKHSLSLEEESTHFQEEESTAQKGNTFLLEDPPYSNCEESSSFQEEFSSMLEKSAAHKGNDLSSSEKEDHSSSEQEQVSDKHHSNQEVSGEKDDSPLLEGFYSQLVESSSDQNETEFYNEEESPIIDDIFPKCKKEKTAFIEESEEQFCDPTVKEDMPDECEPEVPVPIVKLPLLLAKLIVDINIFETMELCIPVDNVSKVEWSLQSYHCKVILPSTTVFLKGVLVADVEFKGKGMKTIQSVKIPVSWSKTTKAEWLHQPKIPNKSQKEYIFTSQNGEDITTHFEFNQSFADEINAEIEMIHFSVNEEFHSWAEQTQFNIQGCVTLSIDLLQEQFIDLHHEKGCLTK